MGIDWEEILDVEGADMAEVYNENIPEEDSQVLWTSSRKSLFRIRGYCWGIYL